MDGQMQLAFAATEAGDFAGAWALCESLRARRQHFVSATLLARAVLHWAPSVSPLTDPDALLPDCTHPRYQHEAFRDLNPALAMGSTASKAHLFVAGVWADLVVGDAVRGVRVYKECGDFAPALYNLGVSYEHGEGVPEVSVPLAASHYERAFLQGHAAAANNWATLIEEALVEKYGYDYEPGSGEGAECTREAVKAVELYREAAVRGYGIAYWNLGLMLSDRKWGVPLDTRGAVEAFRMAADLGDSEARERLTAEWAAQQLGQEQQDAEAAEVQ
eukprot:m51a1_g5396 hypothetical protein (275) ;mRNA; f:44941-46009